MSARRWLVLALAWCGCATVTQAPPAPAEAPVSAPIVRWAPSPVPGPLEPVSRSRPAAVSKTLGNGLRVVVVEDHRVRLVKLRLFFASGSAGDGELTAGATAFALQLLGDRFEPRDDSGELTDLMERSGRVLALAKGASLSFDVTPDVASIGLDGYSRHAPELVKLLDSYVRTPRQGADSFKARRQGAVDLVNELELTDGEALEQFLLQLAFGVAHPYARSPWGTPTSLERVGIEDVIARQTELLTPKGSTLLVVGDVAPEKALAMVERTFGSWRGDAPERVHLAPPRLVKRRNVVFLPRKPSRNTLVCLTRPLPEARAPVRAAMQLAVELVGQARIATELREKFGLTYSVNSTVIERRAASAMAVCSRVRSDDAIQATRLMLEAFGSLATTPPTAEEVERVRAQAITQLEVGQDDLDGIVGAWHAAMVQGKAAPPSDDVSTMKAVTLEQVAAAAKALSDREVLQVILSGEKPMAEAVARANALGPLRTPKLRKVETGDAVAMPE